MRILLSAFLAYAMITAAQAQALPSGKPAGVQQAQFGTTNGLVLLMTTGAAVLIGGLGAAFGSPKGQRSAALSALSTSK